MNLDTGHYFSAQGTGCEVWNWIAGGSSAEEASLSLVRRYRVRSDEALAAVERFVASLLKHNLIRPDQEGGDGTARGVAPTLGEPGAYSPPALQVYTDMEEVLLLDPIHEVASSGWPMPRDAGVPSA
ncbi:MAG: hypothetical protein JWO05_1297 [Gemmatimonadetes bacterium]|nr:hypothetical protein [Gemmatimonadota bacterium]